MPHHHVLLLYPQFSPCRVILLLLLLLRTNGVLALVLGSPAALLLWRQDCAPPPPPPPTLSGLSSGFWFAHSTNTAVFVGRHRRQQRQTATLPIRAQPQQENDEVETNTVWDDSNLAPSLLYQEQENLLIRRGEKEGQLMSQSNNPATPLEAPNVKGIGSGRPGGGGFGGGAATGGSAGSGKRRKGSTTTTTTSKAGRQMLQAQAKIQAQVLKEQGVVRIDGLLQEETADELRAFLYDMRTESEALIAAGEVASMDRFADVLLKTNRWDMPIPLGSPVVANALAQVLLQSSVGPLVTLLLGETAVLYEFSCLMSDPGSQRQVVHPDNPINSNDPDVPVLYTCFIALQDITWDMGPTTWLPGTHTREMHAIFQNDDSNNNNNMENATTRNDEAAEANRGKDWLLQTQPSVVGVLPKGCCAIFDSRVLHCGGANESNQSRALFYFSFKNPNIGYPGNPGSIRPELTAPQQELTLKDIINDLNKYIKGKPTDHIATMDTRPPFSVAATEHWAAEEP